MNKSLLMSPIKNETTVETYYCFVVKHFLMNRFAQDYFCTQNSHDSKSIVRIQLTFSILFTCFVFLSFLNNSHLKWNISCYWIELTFFDYIPWWILLIAGGCLLIFTILVIVIIFSKVRKNKKKVNWFSFVLNNKFQFL